MSPGYIIKLLRTAKKIPQLELAEKLQVTRSYLSQIENEKKEPGLAFLKSVSVYFKLPLPLLVAFDEQYYDTTEIKILNKLRLIFSNLLKSRMPTQ